MKLYHIATLYLLFWGVTACSEQQKTCPTPTPFDVINKADVSKYSLENVIAKTKSIDKPNSSSNSKINIINFWASWCTPCRQELPLLAKIHNSNTANVTLINVGDKQETVEKVLSELNINNISSRRGSSDILSDFSFMGLPASLVITDKQTYLAMGKLKNESAINNWLKCLSE